MFPREEFAARIARARAEMAGRGVDVLLVDHGELLAWLTGYTVSLTRYRAALLPREGAPWFVLRALDCDPCRGACWFGDITGFADTDDPHAAVAASLAARGFAVARIGADFDSYAFTAHTRGRLEALLPDAALVDMTGLSDRLRAVKSPAEIAVLERASAIADAAMAAIHAAAGPGFSARRASAIAAYEFLDRGADTGDVGPVVRGAGDNGFLHATLADDSLAEGDILHVELIPKVRHYGARLMRPIAVGALDGRRAAVARRLVELQDGQLAAMRPGARACDVDALLREPVLAEGLRPSYDNVTGYMLGLYTRTPRTSDFSHVFLPDSRWRLEAGMVFHMYASAQGLAFSETVVVEDGGGRRLTGTPRRVLETSW